MKKLFAVLLFTVVATGCALQGNSPAATVFAAHATYDVALTAALAYKKLPECAPTVSKLCADKETVVTIQKADIVAFDALSHAQAIVRNTTSTQSSLQTAAMWAKEAIGAFSKVVASLEKK